MGPHIIVATFGSNDAKESNWDEEAFEKDYVDLCLEFYERNPRPLIWLVTPPPLFEDGAYEMQQDIVNQELPKAVARVAEKATHTINDPILEMAKKHRIQVPDGA